MVPFVIIWQRHLVMVSFCLSSVQLLMLLVTVMMDETQSCIFDALRPLQVPSTDVIYPLDLQSFHEPQTPEYRRRSRRQTPLDELFAPIRITPFFFDMELKAEEKEELKSVINKSLAQIESIFSVIRVKGPLLMGRTGCRRVWQEGNNIQRCNSIRRGYDGERCADEFKIPDNHLRGLFVWDDSHPDPVQTLFHDGLGVNGTDFILYAQSVSSSRCDQAELNVIAYATYCHVDQNGRPIAAYINICPQMMRDHSNKVSITVLHELFHALGFSSDLFNSFKRCFLTDDGLVTCQPRNRPVRYVNGAQRLVTDRVAEMTSQHLNCYTNQTTLTFGAILQTEDGEVKSHWDAAFLQGSLMMPTISQPHLMFLDKITLALFEDSGWYKVNYGYAEDLRWGKGEGCDFGLNSSCHDIERSRFFCQRSQSSAGCHYLHRDKGRCETNRFLHGCRIYDPQPKDSCLLSPPQSTDDDDDDLAFGESFGPSSRCFRTNLSLEVEGDELLQPLQGRCLQHWCNATNHLFVSVEGNWTFCPSGTLLQMMSGLSGVIECPTEEEEGVLCTRPPSPPPLASTPPHQFTTISSISSAASSADRGNSDDSCVIWLEMSFDSLPVFDNDSKELMEEVKEKLRQRFQLTMIATLDNTSYNMSNVTFIRSRNGLQFALTMYKYRLKKKDVVVMELLRRDVDAGNFSVSCSGSVLTAKAIRLLSAGDGSRSIQTTALPPLSPVVSSGLISAIAIGSVVCFVILTVVVVLFARCCLTRQHRNNRSLSKEPSFHASVV